jgi:hypothetical protein
MKLQLTNLPSKRGLANLKPDLMIDIQYLVARYPEYDAETNPKGVIDIASSVNGLMTDVHEKYCTNNFDFTVANSMSIHLPTS